MSDSGHRQADAGHRLDAMSAAPDHHSILLENDEVRILDTRLGPGEETPLHAHRWPAALYVLSWSHFVRRDEVGAILADSRGLAETPRHGDALWLGPLPPHRVENVGDRDLHIIAVELKQASSAAPNGTPIANVRR